MPSLRFDNLVMQRAAQAAGDVKAILLRQETDPKRMLELWRRTGSLRVKSASPTTGVTVDGTDKSATWFTTSTYAGDAAYTIIASIRIGKVYGGTTASIPLLGFANTAEAVDVVSIALGSDGKLALGKTDTNGTSVVKSDYDYAEGVTLDVALIIGPANATLKIYNASDGTADSSHAVAHSLESTVDYQVEAGGNSLLGQSRPTHRVSSVSNVIVYSGVAAEAGYTAAMGNRSPATTISTGTLLNHFKLSEGGFAAPDSVVGSTDYMVCDPSKPVPVDGGIVFNGRSTGLRVQATLEMEQFYTIQGRSVVSQATYTFFLEGVLVGDPALRTDGQVLADFRGLGKVTLNSSGKVSVIVDGITVTDGDTTIADGDAFSIFATKTAAGAILLTVNEGTTVIGNVDNRFSPPNIDFSDPPKYWVGSDEAEFEIDASSGERIDLRTHFSGVLTKFALFKIEVIADPGPSADALVYISGGSFTDKSGKATGIMPVSQTTKSATCSYTRGPLEDGNYVAVAGGYPVGEGFVEGAEGDGSLQRFTYSLATDLDSLRVGDRLLLASQGVGHVFEEESGMIRPYGLPMPAKNVTAQALALGTLEGAASFGYRWVTAEGTYGPMYRIDPAVIKTTGGNFIVGSTEGAPLGGSELGETALRTHKSTTESASTGSEGNNIFGTPADSSDIVLEVFAKVEEFSDADTRETIWGEGLQAAKNACSSSTYGNNEKQFMTTGNARASLVDLNNEFTIQMSFKYKEAEFQIADPFPWNRWNYKGAMPSQGVFSLGNFERKHAHIRSGVVRGDLPANNASIAAWFCAGDSDSEGGDLIGSAGRWTHRNHYKNWSATTSVYGYNSDPPASAYKSPRLVIAVGREPQSYADKNSQPLTSVTGNRWSPQSDYKVITFTDATELVAGSGSNESIWVEDHDYSLFVIRGEHDNSNPGEGLDTIRVYVNDATDARWYELEGRTMEAMKTAVNSDGTLYGNRGIGTPFNQTNFFESWTDPHNEKTFTLKSCGVGDIIGPTIGVDGQVEQKVNFGYTAHDHALHDPNSTYAISLDNLVKSDDGRFMTDNTIRVVLNHGLRPMHGSAVVFQARIWSSAQDYGDLQNFAHYRYAAQSGGELHGSDVVIDNLCIFNDVADEKSEWQDGSGGGGIVWQHRYSRALKTNAKVFTQDVDYANLLTQPILMLGSTGNKAIGTIRLSGVPDDGTELSILAHDSIAPGEVFIFDSTDTTTAGQYWVDTSTGGVGTVLIKLAEAINGVTDFDIVALADTNTATCTVRTTVAGSGTKGNRDMLVTDDSASVITTDGLKGGMDPVALEDAPLALYYSTRGEGSIVCQTMGKASYVVAHEKWNAGEQSDRFVKLLADFPEVNDFSNYNMFSIALSMTGLGEPGSPGSSYGFRVEGMAINGNVLFGSPGLKENEAVITDHWPAMEGADWITLGGYADGVTSNETTVDIGEFRVWGDEQGPEIPEGNPGPHGWNAGNRLIKDKYMYCHAYFRFILDDTVEPYGASSTNGGPTREYELRNIGYLSPIFNDLTIDANALIYDARIVEDGSSAVAFPKPPRIDIVAIELFRTITQGVVDVEIERDIQNALDSVREAPLYFLTRIPAGTNHYVDTAPNSALGFGAPYTDYSVPEDVKQFFTWQGQLGVVGENNKVYYTEPGPYGWETFPYQLTYEARIAGGGAGPLVACRSTGDTLYLFGNNWATAVVGSPGNETEFPLGSGVGAYSPACTLDINGVVYCFNGRLWMIDRVGQVDFKVEEAGNAFQDLLPTHADVRLATSAKLQSLYIIDQSTGDTIRVYLPTGQASIEKRDAVALGDSVLGEDIWCNIPGSYSVGDEDVYADDVHVGTATAYSGQVYASDTTKFYALSTTVDNLDAGMRVGVVSGGVEVTTRVVSVGIFSATKIPITVEDELTVGTGNIYIGTSVEGMVVDTGYIDTGAQTTTAKGARVSLSAGTGAEVGVSASPVVGLRSDLSTVQFTGVSVEEYSVGADARGRFVRCVLRNRIPEETTLSHISLELTK